MQWPVPVVELAAIFSPSLWNMQSIERQSIFLSRVVLNNFTTVVSLRRKIDVNKINAFYLSEEWIWCTYCIKEKLGIVSTSLLKRCVVIVNLISKQIGCCFLLIGTRNTYDFAINSLTCYDYDDYCGLYPVNTDRDNSSPVFACQFCCKANYQHWIAVANEDGIIAIRDTGLKRPCPKSYLRCVQGKSILIIRTWISSGPWEPHILSLLEQPWKI